jgi:hypothetical protein
MNILGTHARTCYQLLPAKVDRRLERYFSAGASANEEEEDVLRNDRWLREGWSSWDGKRAGCQGAGRISWILPVVLGGCA